MKKGIYSMLTALLDAMTMDPTDWWLTDGSQTPKLAEVAKKSYVHNVKRNRLNCSRANKLVFFHSYIHLQSRFCESYKYGPYKKWDMDLDDSYLKEFFTKLAKIKYESLDANYCGT
ncbi:hypothetical protein CDL12_10169 [Handroanthus impetiginosus]|uniref:Uncharacterized protein n=1 Tax=Handroanthus impetiginosus TaxID=429701 RepID=A0A2G9HI51_9LAMI|nr:hypothetical protein CDL12_10169 [Handroanthus impetiginosus]